MGRRSDHSREELRAMIIAAAEFIVENEGGAGLTMRKVASAIGYTVGSLYLVFRNQDALVLEINARTTDEIYVALENAAARRRTPLSKLQAMARAYIEYARQHHGRWRLAFEHRLPEGEPVPESLLGKIERVYGLTRETLKPLMTDASDAELRTAALALWSGVHGISILALTNKMELVGASPVKRLSGYLVEQFVAGIGLRHGSGGAVKRSQRG